MNDWDAAIEVIKRMGSPWRPHASEIRQLHLWITERIDDEGPRNPRREALMLGVTPEIATLPWPNGVRLIAVDGSQGMIDAFWPGALPGRRHVVRGDWNELPFRPEAFDYAVGDGVFNLQTYPQGFLDLGIALRNLLKPGGCVFVRGFAQLDVKEDHDQVLAAYHAGRLTDYTTLRFLFHTSLQSNVSEGLPGTREFIDEQLQVRGISLNDLYRRTGYDPPPREHAVGDPTRPVRRGCYPTLAEFEHVLTPGFRLLGVRYGSHPLAQRCPIFGLQRAD